MDAKAFSPCPSEESPSKANRPWQQLNRSFPSCITGAAQLYVTTGFTLYQIWLAKQNLLLTDKIFNVWLSLFSFCSSFVSHWKKSTIWLITENRWKMWEKRLSALHDFWFYIELSLKLYKAKNGCLTAMLHFARSKFHSGSSTVSMFFQPIFSF